MEHTPTRASLKDAYLTVRIEPELLHQANQAAAGEDRTTASLVRVALRRYLNDLKNEQAA